MRIDSICLSFQVAKYLHVSIGGTTSSRRVVPGTSKIRTSAGQQPGKQQQTKLRAWQASSTYAFPDSSRQEAHADWLGLIAVIEHDGMAHGDRQEAVGSMARLTRQPYSQALHGH